MIEEKFSKKKFYQTNIRALRELFESNPSNDVLKGFQGFGALKELLLPIDDLTQWSANDLQFLSEVREINTILNERLGAKGGERALESIKNSILSSFYTPEAVTRPLIKNLALSTEPFKAICEPAAGSGYFVSELSKVFPDSQITAIEKDEMTYRILKGLHPQVESIHSPYEDFKNREFDLVISNIPFGSISVYDERIFREANPVKIKSTTRIHNYYFVRSLDMLRDDGVLAFVTTAAFMDTPGNKEIREYMVKNADLISAIRLPNNVFQSAGTSPMTDIIVFRKNEGKKGISSREQKFVNTDLINIKEGEDLYKLNISSYYTSYRDKALGEFVAGGQYRKESLDMVPLSEYADLESSIDSIFKNDFEVYLNGNKEQKTVKTKVITAPEKRLEILPDDFPDRSLYRSGNLVVLKNTVGVVELEDGKPAFRPEPIIKDYEHASALIALRNSCNKLINAELEGSPTMDALRKDLNDQYDYFVFRYGNIYHPANKKLALFEVEGFKLFALEKAEGKNYVKADIFSKQVNNLQKRYAQVETVEDALLLSLNAYSKVDIGFIAEVSAREKEDVILEALEKELLFVDLHKTKTGCQSRFVTKDEFQSGNILQKIEQLSGISPGEIQFLNSAVIDKHIQRLNEVKPTYLNRELIDINIGERWIDIDVYKRFAEHLFKEKCSVKYLSSSDKYIVEVLRYSAEKDITWAASVHKGKIKGDELLEHALADTLPQLTKPDPTDIEGKRRIPDFDGMKNCEIKVKEIKDEFENFITNTPDISEYIEKTYNREFNNNALRIYNGSHLTLPNYVGFTPHPHQKDAPWMLIQREGGIADHVVGAGKSVEIAITAMEMRRLGIARKPMCITLKSTTDAIVKEFKAAYPEAKILAPSEKDFEPVKRKTLFASIMTNDWDCIILTHDQFEAIPQSNAIQLKVLEEELKNVKDDLKALTGDSEVSKQLLKGLEIRKINTTNKIRHLEAAIIRDRDVVDFEKMGIDHLFVDESQYFKNIPFSTRHNNVSGLGNPDGSQRALNVLMAARTIQDKLNGDKGITLLSGTTISNSLVELYLIFKLIRPNRMKEMKINSFDSWAKMYARKTREYEFTVTNEIKPKDRYREFIKVPELAKFYAECAHVVTHETLKIDRPKVVNKVISIEPTESQKKFTQQLIEFARTKDPSHLGITMTDKQLKAYMLLATNYARLMSLDCRLIDKVRYKYESQGKLGQAAREIAGVYNDTSEFKGTQLVFSDIGTPTGVNFNVYGELKRILVEEYSIPGDEIQFIHDHDKGKKRVALFEKINEGDVRIAVGSTDKMGVGVNVQKRVARLHHLDIPWKPTIIEQRNGRGGRPGNFIAKDYFDNKVESTLYATKGTLDSYQFNILDIKQKFINQIKNNTIDQRRIDEGGMDQDGSINFSEYMAVLSGNSDLLEKAKLDKKLIELERTYASFLKRKSEAEFQIASLTAENINQSKFLVRLENDHKYLSSFDPEKTAIKIKDKSYEDRGEAGQVILSQYKYNKEYKVGKRTELAALKDFKLYLEKVSYGEFLHVFVESPEKIKYEYANGNINESSAAHAGRYIIDAVKRIPKVIEKVKEDININSQKIETYKKELTVEFKDKDQIKILKKQIGDLTEKVAAAFEYKEEVKKDKPVEVQIEM